MSKAKRDKNGLRLDVIICAWCQRYYHPQFLEIVDEPDDVQEGDTFSHGICRECAEKVALELEEVASECL